MTRADCTIAILSHLPPSLYYSACSLPQPSLTDALLPSKPHSKLQPALDMHLNPTTQTPSDLTHPPANDFDQLRPSRRLSASHLQPQPLPSPFPTPQTSTSHAPSSPPTMAPVARKEDRYIHASASKSRPAPTQTAPGSLSDRIARRDHYHSGRTQIAKRLRGASPISSSSISSLTELAASTRTTEAAAATTNPAALRTHRRRSSESSATVPSVYLRQQRTRPASDNQLNNALNAPKKRPLAPTDFNLCKMLGSGGTATVFRAEVIPGSPAALVLPVKELALKAVPKKGMTRRAHHYLAREIAIHRNLQQHPNIAGLFEVFEDSAGIYLAMELLRGTDLYTALKRERRGFPESLALQITSQVLEALRYMHSLGYAHRDIKPENIVFTEKPFYADGKLAPIKLIDFGLASARDPNASEKEKLSSEKCGTVRYAAPEIVTETAYVPELCDIWSVGIVLYSIIAHRNPYTGRTEKEVLHQISNVPLSFSTPEWDRVSEDTKQFIRSCLSIRAADRPNAARALQQVHRIVDVLSEQQTAVAFSAKDQLSDVRSCRTKRAHQEYFRGDVSGFSSHVTPDASVPTSRRRDGNSASDGSDSPSSSNGSDGNGQAPNFLDGLLAWFSGGSTPERNGSESAH
ncbi:Calcium/calmodulin-dependent protein kinase type 1 [Gracilariopsis chorda]|uniref:Calcium/calmodulin-dependent protein kinase type 1 n=1 Tax=Gracilariopsis chorda TaxID=448386 RepID=A0A2V3IZE5_9FLOR|nr:Calcium/calmodulin-dependent protein kinase type 1 [Gracilariopsis chorda]|eukprot:PXF47445.1 Calcium/calmodulin-dependent protein kinase type 1 [Gracilariopsis chorda]